MAGKRGKSGGRRPGSGRKPKQEEQEQAAFMAQYLPKARRVEILNRLADIAINSENLKAAVTAGALLLAYSIGKPKETHEHTGEGGGPLEVVVTYVTKASKD